MDSNNEIICRKTNLKNYINEGDLCIFKNGDVEVECINTKTKYMYGISSIILKLGNDISDFILSTINQEDKLFLNNKIYVPKENILQFASWVSTDYYLKVSEIVFNSSLKWYADKILSANNIINNFISKSN
ncbi:hypothetical protein [Dasineura jujubifolia toursvirus 2a]|nr:hypothetical protein [Dasineura jujubifolia toursvirus 2a]